MATVGTKAKALEKKETSARTPPSIELMPKYVDTSSKEGKAKVSESVNSFLNEIEERSEHVKELEGSSEDIPSLRQAREVTSRISSLLDSPEQELESKHGELLSSLGELSNLLVIARRHELTSLEQRKAGIMSELGSNEGKLELIDAKIDDVERKLGIPQKNVIMLNRAIEDVEQSLSKPHTLEQDELEFLPTELEKLKASLATERARCTSDYDPRSISRNEREALELELAGLREGRALEEDRIRESPARVPGTADKELLEKELQEIDSRISLLEPSAKEQAEMDRETDAAQEFFRKIEDEHLGGLRSRLSELEKQISEGSELLKQAYCEHEVVSSALNQRESAIDDEIRQAENAGDSDLLEELQAEKKEVAEKRAAASAKFDENAEKISVLQREVEKVKEDISLASMEVSEKFTQYLDDIDKKKAESVYLSDEYEEVLLPEMKERYDEIKEQRNESKVVEYMEGALVQMNALKDRARYINSQVSSISRAYRSSKARFEEDVARLKRSNSQEKTMAPEEEELLEGIPVASVENALSSWLAWLMPPSSELVVSDVVSSPLKEELIALVPLALEPSSLYAARVSAEALTGKEIPSPKLVEGVRTEKGYAKALEKLSSNNLFILGPESIRGKTPFQKIRFTLARGGLATLYAPANPEKPGFFLTQLKDDSVVVRSFLSQSPSKERAVKKESESIYFRFKGPEQAEEFIRSANGPEGMRLAPELAPGQVKEMLAKTGRGSEVHIGSSGQSEKMVAVAAVEERLADGEILESVLTYSPHKKKEERLKSIPVEVISAGSMRFFFNGDNVPEDSEKR